MANDSPEAEQTESVDEHERQHDVDEVLADVDDERRARVLVGVEHAEHEQVDREADQAEREAAERAGREQRVLGGDVAVLERRADDGPAQHEQPEAGGDGDERDEADAQRRAVDEAPACPCG